MKNLLSGLRWGFKTLRGEAGGKPNDGEAICLKLAQGIERKHTQAAKAGQELKCVVSEIDKLGLIMFEQ